MKFTSLQLGFLAKYFFTEEDLTTAQWATIADIVKEFIGLGDPYDQDLVVEAVKFATTKVPSEKNLHYFVAKVLYWEQGK
jgi:hypothetical protein